MVIRRMTFFFERSIRNKLIVALPLVIAFTLSLFSILSILSLRMQIVENFAGLESGVASHLLLSQTITQIAIMLLTVFASIAVIVSMGHLISDPIRKLAQEADKIADDSQVSAISTLRLTSRKDEVGVLANRINALIERVNRRLTEQEIDASIGKIAAQVAHDIRSPLSSMQVALGGFKSFGSRDKNFTDHLNLLELASKRLDIIATDLLKERRHEETEKTAFSVHKALDELVGEYQLLADYSGIKFVKQYAQETIELFGDKGKFQRSFGNLVKNASEAMEKSGTITLRTEAREDAVRISVSDTGQGIPKEKLERVLRGGFTEGKKDGNGIGMKVICETVEEWKGKMWAQSNEGAGTQFFIELPKSAYETVNTKLEIAVHAGEPVLVIDDDPSLLEGWRLVMARHGRQVLPCDSYEDFISQNITPAMTATAIVDYHFDNSEKDGEDIIRLLKEKGFKYLYLCTAEYWKPSIQDLAAELQITLCPKPLPKIEIRETGPDSTGFPLEARGNDNKQERENTSDELRATEALKAVLIDDDEMMHLVWNFRAKEAGLTLHAFTNPDDFFKNADSLDKEIAIYVDSNLGDGVKGENVSREISELGFKNISLATGYPASSFPEMPWLQKIIGKEPPF